MKLAVETTRGGPGGPARPRLPGLGAPCGATRSGRSPRPASASSSPTCAASAPPSARRASSTTASRCSSTTCSSCSTTSPRTSSATTGAPGSPGCSPRCTRTASARSPRSRSGIRTPSRPRSLESREKAWYQLLFQFEEAEELLLRDDARLLREWLADAPDADRYVEELREPGALTARLGLYRANLHPRGELEDRPLPPVNAPTLGLWSTGDRYLTEAAMVRSGEHVTGPWRYERIEGASHWLQLDAPDRVNRLLLEHLRS